MFILSEILELHINYFIYQQKKRYEFIQPLQGKTLKIEFLEFKNPIILLFDKKQIYIFNVWNDNTHCVIRTYLSSCLLFLTGQFTKEIYFEIHGNLQTTQNLIKFINNIRLNYIHFLFPYINQIQFTKSNYIIKRFLNFISKKNKIFQLCLNAAITDEWKLIPNLLELSWFYKDINILKKQIESLFNRVNKLEKYNGI